MSARAPAPGSAAAADPYRVTEIRDRRGARAHWGEPQAVLDGGQDRCGVVDGVIRYLVSSISGSLGPDPYGGLDGCIVFTA